MRKYLYTAFLLTLFVACSESEQVVQQPTVEELVIGAGYATTVQVDESRVTRATSDFTKNFDLFLYQTAPTTPIDMTSSAIFDAKYESSKYAVYSGSKKWYWDDIGGSTNGGYEAQITLLGIYPKGHVAITDDAVDNIDWRIKPDQSTVGDYGDSDLLVSNKIIDYTLTDQKSAPATLAFEHVLSQITIELVSGTGFTNDFTPENVTLLGLNTTATVAVTSTDIKAAATISNLSGIDLSGKDAITPYKEGTVTAGDVTTITYKAIVLPGQTIAKGTSLVEFTITVDQSKNSYTATMPDDGFGFVQGKNHKFTITVNKTGTTVSASLVPWDYDSADDINRTINIATGTGTVGSNDAKLVDGAKLYVNLDGQSGVYKFTKSPEKWTATTPLYLDHITPDPDGKLFAYAVLINEGVDTGYNVENIYTGESQAMTDYFTDLHFNSFTHPFSKINVIIKTNTAADDYVELSQIKKVELKGLREYASINLTSQVITYATTDAAPAFTAPVALKEAQITCSPVYVNPATIAAKALLLTVYHENGTVKNSYPLYNGNDALTFVANKQYTITVTLSKTEISDLGVTIKGWEDDGSTIGGGSTIDE